MLTDFGFDGDNSPVIIGSALLALKGDSSDCGEGSINRLLQAMDEFFPTPTRDLQSPFMIPIDNSFTVPGRGTVVVGTIKRGSVKKNAEAELLGFDAKIKTTIGDIHVFKKSVPIVSSPFI